MNYSIEQNRYKNYILLTIEGKYLKQKSQCPMKEIEDLLTLANVG